MQSEIGTRIKTIIRERGYRQNFVAERTGYSPKVFSDLLCGRRTITADDVIKISPVLNSTPNELLGLGDHQPALMAIEK